MNVLGVQKHLEEVSYSARVLKSPLFGRSRECVRGFFIFSSPVLSAKLPHNRGRYWETLPMIRGRTQATGKKPALNWEGLGLVAVNRICSMIGVGSGLTV